MSLEQQISALVQQVGQCSTVAQELTERVASQADAIDTRVQQAVLAVPLMRRSYWVDAANGSDTANDGSINAPFATLKAAIDATPEFGGAFITVLGNYTLSTEIHLRGRNIRIVGDGTNTLTFDAVITEHNNIAGFRLFDFASQLQFTKINLDVSQTRDDAKTDSTNYCVVSIYGGASGSAIYTAEASVNAGNVPLLSVASGIASLYCRDTQAVSSVPVVNNMTGLCIAALSNSSQTGASWFASSANVVGGAS